LPLRILRLRASRKRQDPGKIPFQINLIAVRGAVIELCGILGDTA